MSFWDTTLSSPAAANIALSGSNAFYVMMAGAFQNTAATTPADGDATGFVSPNFVAVGGTSDTAYEGADYATYHKFIYSAAYAGSSTTRMTTFRGRGGMGSTAT